MEGNHDGMIARWSILAVCEFHVNNCEQVFPIPCPATDDTIKPDSEVEWKTWTIGTTEALRTTERTE
jgi:hypothetical protein